MNLFGLGNKNPGTPPNQQQGGTPATPGNLPTPDTRTAATKTDGNGDVPAGATDDKNKSPLDAFSEMFKTKPNDPEVKDVNFNTDPAELAKLAEQIDFTKVVDANTLKAIQAGGEDAASALMLALTKVSQNVYANSAVATTRIVEAALKKQKESFTNALPEILRRANINSAMRESNPIFNHPAVSPMVKILESHISSANPDYSPRQVTEAAQNYFSTFMSEFGKTGANANSGGAGGTGKAGAGDIDWSQFAGL